MKYLNIILFLLLPLNLLADNIQQLYNISQISNWKDRYEIVRPYVRNRKTVKLLKNDVEAKRQLYALLEGEIFNKPGDFEEGKAGYIMGLVRICVRINDPEYIDILIGSIQFGNGPLNAVLDNDWDIVMLSIKKHLSSKRHSYKSERLRDLSLVLLNEMAERDLEKMWKYLADIEDIVDSQINYSKNQQMLCEKLSRHFPENDRIKKSILNKKEPQHVIRF